MHVRIPWSRYHSTLRTPWSWQNIVSTTVPERAVLSVMSLGVALQTDESGASEAAETFIFLASIWLAVTGHVVLFWLWLPRRGRWTAPVDSEIQRKICEMLEISVLKGYQVEALYLNGSTNAIRRCVCADWDQKLCVSWSRRNPHRDRPRHCQWVSSLVQHLWLARFVQAKYALWYRFEKRPPVTLRRSQISSDAVAVR